MSNRIISIMDNKMGNIDWNNGTVVSIPYTASQYGMFWAALSTGEDSTQRWLQVNGYSAAFVMGRSQRSGGDSNAYLFLSPGDTVTNLNSASIITCTFWPFKS